MDKFYPKNFVMWRPQLLLLLIFLEAIYDSTGLVKGVGASYMSGDYESYCTADAQCKMGLACDMTRNECKCRNFFKKPRLMALHAVYYDRKSATCVSPVGKVCTLKDKDDGLWKIPCVPYASCMPQPGKQLPDVLGLCQCNPEFEETEEHLCKLAMVIQIGNGNPIVTMAHQRGGLPTDENMSAAGDSTDEAGSPPAQSLPQGSVTPGNGGGMNTGGKISLTETEDENAHVDVVRPVVENWTEANLPKSGANPVRPYYYLFITSFLAMQLLIRN